MDSITRNRCTFAAHSNLQSPVGDLRTKQNVMTRERQRVSLLVITLEGFCCPLQLFWVVKTQLWFLQTASVLVRYMNSTQTSEGV